VQPTQLKRAGNGVVPHQTKACWRPVHQRQAARGVFINVQGKSRFTADEVNDLMEQLIERQRDGDQLVLVR